MRKPTNLLRKGIWKKQVSPDYVISKPSVCIIDAMGPLHKISGEKKTFGYLTEIIFASALKDDTSNGRINIIFDVYKNINR